MCAVVGRIPHDRSSPTALNACDVFLSVPSVDATAVSLLEAMSCGRAIIVSALASAREWVDDGVSGLVVPPRDVERLTAAMLAHYAADPDLRRAHGEAALAVARAEAGFDANMATPTASCGAWSRRRRLARRRRAAGAHPDRRVVSAHEAHGRHAHAQQA